MLLPMLALVLSVAGFGVILSNAIAPRAGWLSPIRRRGLEVHLWGCEFLGAGSLLAGVVWALQRSPWWELPLLVRVAAGLAAGCAGLYGASAGVAFLRGTRGWRRPLAVLDLTPRAGEPVPVRFGALVLLGTLVLSVLVVWSS